jgi:hypothetical protein
MVTPRAKRVVMDDPEDTDEEPEYDSALPPTPVMGDDEDRYYPRSSSRSSFTGDDEDYGGDSDYTPRWAREEEESSEDPVCDECDGRGGKEYPFQGEMEYDVCRQCDGSGKSRFSKYSKGDDEEEEHEGARMDPREGKYDRSEDYDEDAYNDEADLDDSGPPLSKYEKARKKAIDNNKEKEENNEDIKMSPQQMNQWMYNQRTSRMQNNLKQNERWGNY